jgi:hypothetical protein
MTAPAEIHHGWQAEFVCDAEDVPDPGSDPHVPVSISVGFNRDNACRGCDAHERVVGPCGYPCHLSAVPKKIRGPGQLGASQLSAVPTIRNACSICQALIPDPLDSSFEGRVTGVDSGIDNTHDHAIARKATDWATGPKVVKSNLCGCYVDTVAEPVGRDDVLDVRMIGKFSKAVEGDDRGAHTVSAGVHHRTAAVDVFQYRTLSTLQEDVHTRSPG